MRCRLLAQPERDSVRCARVELLPVQSAPRATHISRLSLALLKAPDRLCAGMLRALRGHIRHAAGELGQEHVAIGGEAAMQLHGQREEGIPVQMASARCFYSPSAKSVDAHCVREV